MSIAQKEKSLVAGGEWRKVAKVTARKESRKIARLVNPSR